MPFEFSHPYEFDPAYSRPVAYFCMEYAIHQSFKIYAGGLGFLAGSHMHSAFDLKQNLVGIGILWKYGYYDQVRKADQTMDILFQEKVYGFLQKTGIKFTINISGHEVWVTAWYLSPAVFNTVPMFFLSTDLPEKHQQDELDAACLYELLEKEVIPLYYDYPQTWLEIMKEGMRDIFPQFDSARLARQYYKELYNSITVS